MEQGTQIPYKMVFLGEARIAIDDKTIMLKHDNN